MVETSHRGANRSFWATKRADQRQQIQFSRRVGVRGGIVRALGMRGRLCDRIEVAFPEYQ
jgi:hypothetical protein